MRRRGFVALAGAALGSPFVGHVPASRAQTPKVPRVGFLSSTGPTVTWAAGGFQAGLREQGYVEGQSIHVEYRWAHGQFDRLPDLAAELVRLNVDVIAAILTQAALAAQAATRTIPIVMVVGDPVSVGLTTSLARPGGNITGVALMNPEIVGKQLELLKEVNPKLARVAVLWNPANAAFQALQVREAELAGRKSGVQLHFLEARGPYEFDAAFAAMRREGLHALLILGDPVFALHSATLAGMAVKDRLLTASGGPDFVHAGGLMAYAPSFFESTRRAATYVSRVLKGAKPADLPIEQPTRFELMINLGTAKALGLTIPPSILARADEVIE
jgi:putative ABC transport system substrate-binding protein